jgi:hypothetical protein
MGRPESPDLHSSTWWTEANKFLGNRGAALGHAKGNGAQIPAMAEIGEAHWRGDELYLGQAFAAMHPS